MQKKLKVVVVVIVMVVSNNIFCQPVKPSRLTHKNSLVCKKYKRATVQITYWKNKNLKDSTSRGVAILFGEGFDTFSDLSVYYNKKLLKSIQCKTNYSVGYCFDSLRNIASVFIPYDNIKQDNFIKISTKDEFILIRVPANFTSYNRLKIFRKNGWKAAFIRDFNPFFLE